MTKTGPKNVYPAWVVCLKMRIQEKFASQAEPELFGIHCTDNIRSNKLVRGLKEPSLGTNLFSIKVTHKNEHLCKISFSNDIWFLSCAKLQF